jgi:hypothetical protein
MHEASLTHNERICLSQFVDIAEMRAFGSFENFGEVAVHFKVVCAIGLLDFFEAEDVEEQVVGDIVFDECAADAVVEELLGKGEDGAGGVAVGDDRLDRVLIPVVVHIFLYIILIGIKPPLVISRPQLPVQPRNDP